MLDYLNLFFDSVFFFTLHAHGWYPWVKKKMWTLPGSSSFVCLFNRSTLFMYVQCTCCGLPNDYSRRTLIYALTRTICVCIDIWILKSTTRQNKRPTKTYTCIYVNTKEDHKFINAICKKKKKTMSAKRKLWNLCEREWAREMKWEFIRSYTSQTKHIENEERNKSIQSGFA